MRRYKRYIVEILAILALGVFMAYMLREKGTSGIKPQEIEQILNQEEKLQVFSKASALALKRTLGTEFDGVEYFYYTSEDFMEVREILVLKSSDKSLLEEASARLQERVSERRRIFESYGPEQFALLGRAVFYQVGDYYIYIVAEDAGQLLARIRQLVEG